MFPATTKGGGLCFAFPDVCKTPAPPSPSPVPVPYPNIGMLNQVTGESTKVKFVHKGVVTKKSKMNRSQGDEAGVAGGVVSGMNMGPVQYKKGSSKVKIQGQPCVHLASMTGHNGTNANMPSGAQVAPSQTKVIIAP